VKAALPPSYVNAPVPIAYAEAEDALIVTMIRILGLCWAYDYERTPALTSEQVATLTGRARSTLYRHLKELRDRHWIRVDPAGRKIIIRPVADHPAKPAEEKEADMSQLATGPAPSEELMEALADIGVENPKRAVLARMAIDPLWVRAWRLWAEHPHRRGLTNPVGNIILKLESGEPPPRQFLQEAEEQTRRSEWMRDLEERKRRPGRGGATRTRTPPAVGRRPSALGHDTRRAAAPDDPGDLRHLVAGQPSRRGGRWLSHREGQARIRRVLAPEPLAAGHSARRGATRSR
jgi:hypothetical protein